MPPLFECISFQALLPRAKKSQEQLPEVTFHTLKGHPASSTMNAAWTCKACTWSNDDATTFCVMCQTFRPRCKSGGTTTSTGLSSAEASKPSDVAAALESAVASEKENGHPMHDDNVDNGKVEQEKNAVASLSQWDAFATLQSNYESSSDDESGDHDSENHHSDEGSERDCQSPHGGGKQWDAFESLESNYRSSDDSDTASEYDEEESRKSPLIESPMKGTPIECIDLVESEDEDTDGKLHATTERCGKRRLDLVDSDEDPSTRNSHPQVRRKRRIKKLSNRAVTKRKSPITLLDDSSISEESSRPPPSSVTRSSRSTDTLTPWQRSIPLHQNQILSSNKTLPSSCFSCMNGRNDVRGGSGAGVNGFHVSRTDEDEKKGSKRKAKETGGATKKAKSVSGDAGDAEKPKKARPKGKRRYRRRGRSGAASKSGTKRVAPRRTTTTNDAWSSRERGIRQRNNRSRGPATSSYMMIGKQESALRSIGGASVTF